MSLKPPEAPSGKSSFSSLCGFSTAEVRETVFFPEVAIDALSVIGNIDELVEPETSFVESLSSKDLRLVVGREEFVMPENGGSVLAIAGCTNSGKTTVAEMLVKMFLAEKATVALIHQDNFYYGFEQVEKVSPLRKMVDKIFHGRTDSRAQGSFYYSYDEKESVDKNALINAIAEACCSHDYVIVEGNMLTEWDDLVEMCDRVIFLSMNQETCRRRRLGRTYDPPDVDGYFDDVAWPAYQRHLQRALALARDDKRISFFDVSSDCDKVTEEALIEMIQAFSNDVIRIGFDALDVNEVMKLINTPSCGATSIFVGTTRDTFQDRLVQRLDYESYDEMAYKELRKLCDEVHAEFPSVERVVIFHRIGEVPVSEISVIVATASPHRKEAIRACEFGIDELKRRVPIWKKEVYEDGGCSWKENGESDPQSRRHGQTSTEERDFAAANSRRDARREVFLIRHFMRQLNLKSPAKEK
ncbi:unnamed protein product [Caenorhabditis auriculariae]|uniref:Molybdopterin synthase catalytic subunit n=1 Tax=Caenorhabditis auriculariae TaxID=2777116 RepID=A0A8S1GNL0_9PELO|nr:unnamed protein product [Caenorhabditis auriculariae]